MDDSDMFTDSCDENYFDEEDDKIGENVPKKKPIVQTCKKIMD